MLCSICGRPITGNKTTDHIYPQEIAKWQYESGPEIQEKVQKVIGSKCNRAPAHRKCNYEKQDQMPDLMKIHISAKQRQRLQAAISEIQKEIEQHESRKNAQKMCQEQKCYCCGKPLGEDCVLRRIDPEKERVWENACMVCRECNDNYSRFG